jgi:hypothetical protein
MFSFSETRAILKKDDHYEDILFARLSPLLVLRVRFEEFTEMIIKRFELLMLYI